MSYLHCHKCGWSQDDFWDFGFGKYGYLGISPGIGWAYNPISCFLSHVFSQTWYKSLFRYGLIVPKRIRHDASVIEDYGWKRSDPHSWWLIWYEFKRMIWKFQNQEYWRDKDFKNSKVKRCPKCLCETELDID